MRMSKEDRVCKKLRNRVLMEGNPGTQLFGVGGHEEHLGQVINDIQRLLDGCFDFNLNPLPHLRRYFPDFDWQGWKPQTTEEVVTIAEENDYTWVTNSNSDWSTGIVTATRRSSSDNRKKFYVLPRAIQGGKVEMNTQAWATIAGAKLMEGTKSTTALKFLSFDPARQRTASIRAI